MDYQQDIYAGIKKKRPIASGELSKKNSLIYYSILDFVSLSLCFSINQSIFLLFILYLILNVIYTIRFKYFVIIDVFIIAAGFVIRILIGSILIKINPSHWIIIATFLIALFLGFSKRRGEINNDPNNGHNQRKVLEQYSIAFIDQINL